MKILKCYQNKSTGNYYYATSKKSMMKHDCMVTFIGDRGVDNYFFTGKLSRVGRGVYVLDERQICMNCGNIMPIIPDNEPYICWECNWYSGKFESGS